MNQATIRYPPIPDPQMDRKTYHAQILNAWRMREKRLLLRERGPRCERPGCGAKARHLDEAIIPRCDAMGLPIESYSKIFCSINLALLCPDCNCNQAHDREGAWYRACRRYGEQAVFKWYQDLGLVAPRGEWIKDNNP